MQPPPENAAKVCAFERPLSMPVHGSGRRYAAIVGKACSCYFRAAYPATHSKSPCRATPPGDPSGSQPCSCHAARWRRIAPPNRSASSRSSRPGGSTDLLARVPGQKLAQRWGQQTIVASEFTAKAPPDRFSAQFRTEIEKWGKVIKAFGARPD